jgi:hypothetical protein
MGWYISLVYFGKMTLTFVNLKFEIVYNMYRVKPPAVSRPSLLCQ